MDWNSVEDAYGPAGQVGDLLADVCSGDRDAAADAAWGLQDRVAHSDAVTEAASPLVGALLDLLAAGGVPHPAELLAVLRGIAQSLGAWDQPWVRESEPGRGWERDCATRLREGAGVIERYLDADDPETRSLAALLWALVEEDPARAFDVLSARVRQEHDPRARACMAAAATSAWARLPEAGGLPDWLCAEARSSPCSAARIAAAAGRECLPDDITVPDHLPPQCTWPSEV